MDQNSAVSQTNPPPVSPQPSSPGIPLPVTSSPSNDGWELETLIQKALKRTWERMLSFVIVYVIGFLVAIGLILAIILVGAFLVGLIAALKVPMLVSIFSLIGVLLVVGLVIFIVYLSAWYQLTATYIVVADQKPTMAVAFKATKPLIWGSVWLGMISGIFMLGLLPISLITLFVIWIVWNVWGSFNIFVYLEFKKKGLGNLWLSKALVGQKFWGILFRYIVIFGAYGLFIGALGYVGKGVDNSGVAGLLALIRTLLMVFFSVFSISFLYEMYKNTKKDIEVKTPKIWLGISILGLIVMALVIFGSFAAIASKSGEIMNQIQKQLPGIQKSLQKNQQYKQQYNGNINQQDFNNYLQQQQEILQTTPGAAQQKAIQNLVGTIVPKKPGVPLKTY